MACPRRLRREHLVGHGQREWTTDLDEHELTLGVQDGPDDGLGYDFHVEYYRHKQVETGINLVSERLARAAILSGDYDLANPRSPASENRQAIRDMSLRMTRVTEDEYKRANASLDGAAFTTAGGAVRWTVGVEVEDREWRDIYDYRDSNNRFHEVADVLGAGDESVAGDRRRWSVMAESTVPVLDGWDLTLGARRDDYDDVGEAISLLADNRYRLNDALAFRAFWRRAAHPPGLGILHLPEARYFVPYCDPLLKNDDGSRLCDTTHLITGGNPDLEPYQVERISVGATATVDAFSFAADWFSVDHTDLPAIANWQVVVDRAAAGTPLPGTSVERGGDGAVQRIIAPVGQFRETETEGVALQAGAAWETDRMDIALDVRATRTIRYKSSTLGIENPGGYPRDRAHAVLQANWGDITARWDVYTIAGYENSTETARFKRWTGQDLALRWRDVLGSGLDLTGGVLNVADRGPSIDPSGEDGPAETLDSVRGRTFFLNATMTW